MGLQFIMEIQLKCSECKIEFEGSRKTYADLAYCKPCRKKHSKDILEIITEDSFTVYNRSQVEEAEADLAELKAELRLDLHKTLDTLPFDTELSASTCCVSYVGQLTSTRIQAREEIQERIRTGQLKFGALVFARGPRKNPEACNSFTDVGSKAWFNKLVKGENPIFVDDSEDHVLSVEGVGVQSIQLFSDQHLLLVLEAAVRGNAADESSSEDITMGGMVSYNIPPCWVDEHGNYDSSDDLFG